MKFTSMRAGPQGGPGGSYLAGSWGTLGLTQPQQSSYTTQKWLVRPGR